MALVVTGMLAKQIAGELGTAEDHQVHRAQVMHKMQAESSPSWCGWPIG